MDSPNLVAIVLAAITNMIVGAVWYAPQVFGVRWAKAAGIEHQAADTRIPIPAVYGGSFVCSLVLAFALEHLLRTFGPATWMETFQILCWMWLGFACALRLPNVLFEGRSRELYLLNIGHDFLSIFVMGATILMLS